MNLGQAVAVCLYELVRELKVPAKPEKEAAATAAGLDRLTATVFEALWACGYLKSTGAPTEEKVRPVVRRLSLSSEDAPVWLGILRQMLWKIRSKA
jgi:tRNA/rRNA methyltransferase